MIARWLSARSIISDSYKIANLYRVAICYQVAIRHDIAIIPCGASSRLRLRDAAQVHASRGEVAGLRVKTKMSWVLSAALGLGL